MRKVLVIFLLFTPTVCLAYALHIGNVSIPVHSEKYTTPSYNIKTEFGDIYHIPMTPQNISGTLHAMTDDGTTYSACSGTKTHVGHYWFIGPCLVGVDDDVYLESTGTQYIDTGVIRDNGKNNTDEEYNYIWGSHGNVSPYGRNYFEFDPDGVGDVGAGAYYLTDHNIFNLNDVYDIDMATFVNGTYLDVNNSSVSIQILGAPTDWRASDNLRLFGVARENSSSTAKARLYYIIFMNENNQTMAHFVPVPAGMRIGNYTVPSNGMWDVVEQKFYGNDGTGNFIYGVDE